MASDRDRARARGRALERRLADRLGGLIWAGERGDVVAGPWVIEAKYRRGYRLERLDQLREWVAQAKANLKDPRHRDRPYWAIVCYGGPGTEYLAILPLAQFQQLAGLGVREEAAHADPRS